jgi:hypothetical protein
MAKDIEKILLDVTGDVEFRLVRAKADPSSVAFVWDARVEIKGSMHRLSGNTLQEVLDKIAEAKALIEQRKLLADTYEMQVENIDKKLKKLDSSSL